MFFAIVHSMLERGPPVPLMIMMGHWGGALPAKRPLAHAATSGARTQVSLVPPPWLELTTSEPSLRATRVSPPGTMVIFLPDSTNGRRSTCRGATPCATKVGQVESASVGWAT